MTLEAEILSISLDWVNRIAKLRMDPGVDPYEFVCVPGLISQAVRKPLRWER